MGYGEVIEQTRNTPNTDIISEVQQYKLAPSTTIIAGDWVSLALDQGALIDGKTVKRSSVTGQGTLHCCVGCALEGGSTGTADRQPTWIKVLKRGVHTNARVDLLNQDAITTAAGNYATLSSTPGQATTILPNGNIFPTDGIRRVGFVLEAAVQDPNLPAGQARASVYVNAQF